MLLGRRRTLSVQASELQEMNMLIKEAERLLPWLIQPASLSAMQRTACLKTTVGAAVNYSRSPLSSPSRVIPSLSGSVSKSQTSPSQSVLLAATTPFMCPTDTPQCVIRKKVQFSLVRSSAPRLNPHTDFSFLSCSCSKCNSFENSKGLWLVYSQRTAFCHFIKKFHNILTDSL